MKQVTVRIEEETHKELRMKLLEENDSIQKWFERQVEKYLKGEIDVKKTKFEVIEDNGGGMYLVAFKDDTPVFFGTGYQHNRDNLLTDTQGLMAGEDPQGWEGESDPVAAYDELISHEYGWEIIADQDMVYVDKMGKSGTEALIIFRSVANVIGDGYEWGECTPVVSSGHVIDVADADNLGISGDSWDGYPAVNGDYIDADVAKNNMRRDLG